MAEMMDQEDTMQGETGMETDKPGMGEPSGDDESVSVFLPKEITMGKTFKQGDEIVLKIVDVDPETGELEAKYATDDQESKSEGGSMDDAFDAAMPADKEGY